MGKCIKTIALSVMAAIFSITALASPVFADPVTNPNGETSQTTTPENTSETTPTTTPAPTDNTTDQNTENTENTENKEEEKTKASCYDQVGGLGWIVCPGTGLLGKIIDGAYGILENYLLKIDPIPTDTESPIFVVWNYFKNITNILFIVFFLVVIFSQITGVGINNYGIKKILPRIIITAILVNLSYIICTLAVDISNILGNSFQDFFMNIQNYAIENGTVSDTAQNVSVGGVVATILGIGGVGMVTLSVAGGIEGVLWLLIPIIFAGMLAVISAVVTMAARQALIFLLVMISPLAFIAYMLPNTEKWFSKWYRMLFQMIIFYPMFSILYGASQLAGLVIITSANNWFGVVLGIAVKVLPLFMCIPLLRSSNSLLGKIDGAVRRIGSPAGRAFGGYAAERQALAQKKALQRKPITGSQHLAQFMATQKAKRAYDLKQLSTANEEKFSTRAMTSMIHNGKLTNRGLRQYKLNQQHMQNETLRQNWATDFDEGFKADGTDSRVRRSQLKKVDALNKAYDHEIVASQVADTRKRTVTLSNMERRAQMIHEGAKDASSEIHQQILQSFNVNSHEYSSIAKRKLAYDEAAELVAHNKTLTAEQRAAYNAGDISAAEKIIFNSGQKAISATLSDAITAKRKVDHEARSNYTELYDDYEAGPLIKQQLIRAFENKDYNSMSAALQIMYKRGDKDDIHDVIRRYSSLVKDNNDIRFQKELNDVCLSFKAEDIDIAQWAKANMMRRGMNGKGNKIEAFIDYDSWMRGVRLGGDENDRLYQKTERITLAKAMSNWDAIATADRTMWNQILDDQKSGALPASSDVKENARNIAVFPVKYLRSAVCSGRMDGERLESFNNWFVGGCNIVKDANGNPIAFNQQLAQQSAYFRSNADSYKENIIEFLRDMTAGQLASLKTATLEKLNDTLNIIEGGNYVERTDHLGNKKLMNNDLLKALDGQISQINNNNSMAGTRTSMNPAVRKMLNIKED